MDVITIGESMILFTPVTMGQMRYVSEYSAKIAGAESNVAIGLSRLGHEVGWISRLGNDEFGKKILNFIRGEGVDDSQVSLDMTNKTGLYFKEMITNDEVDIHYYRKNSAASHMDPVNIDESYIATAKYLHITGITPALSRTCYETVMKAIEIARKNGIKVVFDPNLRKKLWSETQAKQVLLAIASKSDIVLPSIEEGKFLTEEKTPETIAQAFYHNGASQVVLKLGDQGAYYYTKEEKRHVPPFPVKQVIDPVGAGDGFVAGFLSGLLDNLGMEKSVKKATVIGSLVTMVEGDIEGLPDRDRLNKFINEVDTEDITR